MILPFALFVVGSGGIGEQLEQDEKEKSCALYRERTENHQCKITKQSLSDAEELMPLHPHQILDILHLQCPLSACV